MLVRSAIGWKAPEATEHEAPGGMSEEDKARAEQVIKRALERFRSSGGFVAGQAQEVMA